MLKINPSYRVTVYYNLNTDNPEQKIVEYPITCKFNSQRSTFSDANKCTIQLYNLAEDTRIKFFKDPYIGDLESKNWKFIKLEAGWNGQLSQIFFGKILQAYSTKAGGQVDIITNIECQPFDIFTTQSAYTFEAGTTYKEAFKTLASDLKNCQIGNIGALEGTFKTQTTFDGNTMSCLKELTNGNTFVDNGVLNCIMDNEVIEVPVPLVTDNNGLLQTPIKQGARLIIKMLFEPTLIVGQLLEIKSSVQDFYNGQYKVLGFTHDCLISPTQAGQRITTVELWAAPELFSTNINVTNEAVTGGAANVNTYKVNKEERSPLTPVSVTPKWIKPCDGLIVGEYGEPRKDHVHNGIDIKTPIGTPVKAIADGTVVVVGPSDGYGIWVGINHGIVNGVKVSSEYGHLSRYCVKYGQKVKQGDIIAYSGNTGYSEGPHLHLTIRQGNPGKGGGKAVNPWQYINR